MPTALQKRHFSSGDEVKIAKKTTVVDKDDGVECDLTGEKVLVDGDPYQSPSKNNEFHVPVRTSDGATIGIPVDRLERCTPTPKKEDGFGGGGGAVSKSTMDFWKKRFAQQDAKIAQLQKKLTEKKGSKRRSRKKVSS